MKLRMRPRFTMRVTLPPDAVLERFRETCRDCSAPCRVDLLEGLAELAPLRAERRVWSPYLKLVVDPGPGNEGDGALLDGRFGPNANLWTFFVALYAIAGICGGIALLWAYSQVLLGGRPTALWAFVAASILAAGVWVAGQVGQRLARQQMQQLYSIVRSTVGDVLQEEALTDVQAEE